MCKGCQRQARPREQGGQHGASELHWSETKAPVQTTGHCPSCGIQTQLQEGTKPSPVNDPPQVIGIGAVMVAHCSWKTLHCYHNTLRAWVPRQPSEKKPTTMGPTRP